MGLQRSASSRGRLGPPGYLRSAGFTPGTLETSASAATLPPIHQAPPSSQPKMAMVPKDSHSLTLFIEHCLAPRPSPSLKGASAKYTELCARLEENLRDHFDGMFDGRIDLQVNPPPRNSPLPFMEVERAVRFLKGFSEAVVDQVRAGLQVVDISVLPPRLHPYPRLGAFEVCAPSTRHGWCTTRAHDPMSTP